MSLYSFRGRVAVVLFVVSLGGALPAAADDGIFFRFSTSSFVQALLAGVDAAWGALTSGPSETAAAGAASREASPSPESTIHGHYDPFG